MTMTLTRPRFFRPSTIHSAMRAAMMTLQKAVPIAAIVLAATAALAIMTAVQPMSWMTFSPANNLAPCRPKEICTVSMALRPVRPPMTPAPNMTAPPMTWPIMMARSPLPNPSGARSIPVSISAIEMPAPNHKSPFDKTEVFVSFMKKHPSFLFPLELQFLQQPVLQDQGMTVCRVFRRIHECYISLLQIDPAVA